MRLADLLLSACSSARPNSGIGGDVTNAVLVGVAAEDFLRTDEDAAKAGEALAVGPPGVPLDGECSGPCWLAVERERCRAPNDEGRFGFGSILLTISIYCFALWLRT